MTLKKIFEKPWLSSASVILTGLYYGTLDIWGDEWGWIKNNLDVHSFVYCFLLLITVISVLLKCFIEYHNEKDREKLKIIEQGREKLLKDFLSFIKNVVHQKKNRFFDKVSKISNDRQRINFFEEITHPIDQIRQIMAEAVNFLEKYGVPRNQIEMTVVGYNKMTVVGYNNKIAKWTYSVKLDRQKNYKDPEVLMSNCSLAKKSMENGESIFLSDLNEGIRQNVFYESNKSGSVQNIGSIYCKPVTLKIQNNTYKYVFTLVSYGTYLCSPNDQQEANEFLTLLDEIGDRVELELYLLAMKQHKE